jgi:hypothetical protein
VSEICAQFAALMALVSYSPGEGEEQDPHARKGIEAVVQEEFSTLQKRIDSVPSSHKGFQAVAEIKGLIGNSRVMSSQASRE